MDDAAASLRLAVILTLAFFVVEVVGGIASGSLSLLGDAGHMLRDVFALLLSLSAISIAERLPTKTKTFGYHRVEVLAAFVNGLLLIVVSVWIFWEAYHRFLEPRPIRSLVMLAVATIGLAVNLYVALRLHGSHDVNVRSAFVHVLTDTVSSAAVIGASIWIYLTGQTVVDAVMGAAIGVFVLYSAVTIIRDTVRILLEFTPPDVDLDEVIADMQGVEGVEGVHNVHLWTLCSNVNVLDAHIYTGLMDMTEMELTKAAIKQRLEKYNIRHATLEFECERCALPQQLRHIEH